VSRRRPSRRASRICVSLLAIAGRGQIAGGAATGPAADGARKPSRTSTTAAMTTTISATARPRCSPLSTCLTASCMQRHRHQEFIRFLNTTEAETRDGKSSTSSSTITVATSTPKCAPGSIAIPLRVPLHAEIGLLAQCCRGLLRQANQATAGARCVPLARRSPGRHQTFPLPRSMTAPRRSSGPPIPIPSLPLSDVGTKC